MKQFAIPDDVLYQLENIAAQEGKGSHDIREILIKLIRLGISERDRMVYPIPATDLDDVLRGRGIATDRDGIRVENSV